MAKDKANEESTAERAAQLEDENAKLRAELANRDAGEKNASGLALGSKPDPRPLGGQSTEQVTLSVGNLGNGIQVIHNYAQQEVAIPPKGHVDDVVFDGNTAQRLIENSERGVGTLVVRGHEASYEKRAPQPTRAQIEEKEAENLKAGQEAESSRVRERPQRIGTGAGLPPERNPQTGERSSA